MTRHILCFILLLPLGALHAATNTPAAIPWNQIGAKAGADYKGDGLTVTPTPTGAQLHCVFQRLDAEATPEGLWLTSTVANSTPDRFRVTAIAIGRAETPERGSATRSSNQSPDPAPIFSNRDEDISTSLYPSWVWPPPLSEALASTGQVTINNQTVRFTRPGLTEEYTTTMDGLRQDFIVNAPPNPREASWSAPVPWRFSNSALPTPHSALILTLSVTGARVEPAPDGARLVLQNSGRKIAYTRLRVTDATGKELQAHIEVPSEAAAADVRRRTNSVGDEVMSLKSPDLFDDTFDEQSLLSPFDASLSRDDSALRIPHSALVIVINDSSAQYPLRIDPTFSDANWVSMGDSPNVNNEVFAAVTDNQGNLYIGGVFTAVGSVSANYLAKWNGMNWSGLGSGVGPFNPSNPWGVTALAVSNNTLYAGGQFSTAGGITANNIAQWNGTNWSALGSGISGGNGYNSGPVVRALAMSGSTLYAGGSFTNAGGILASNIAQWNGSSWSALGSGMSGNQGLEFGINCGVYALAVSGGALYAGGYFTNAGGIPANCIAQWNGSSWSALGLGITGDPFGYGTAVDALILSGGTLYAGGIFTSAGGFPANSLAQWSNGTWSALGSGVTGGESAVWALAESGGTLYVGGSFTNAGGIPANSIAQWNGTNWSALNSGAYAYIRAFAVSSNILYTGGYFIGVGGITISNLAQWNGTNWSGVTRGINEYVNCFTVSGGTLYAGGVYGGGVGYGTDFVAQWAGTNWMQLGSAFNNSVLALAVNSNILYAGGQFTRVGANTQLHNIAQWNGTNWLTAGTYGLGGTVNALLATNGYLYAGGNFGGHIAQWNGTYWATVGYGLVNDVFSLAVSGNTLYTGGQTYIGQWNGTNWSALGSNGVDGTVYALAIYDGTLYAGGTFPYAYNAYGQAQVNYISQWNGTNWLPIGSGMNGYVNGLAVYGGILYAGGNFTMAGGSPANYLAQWNGTNWSALGSGLNNQVNALAVSGNTLYVGGDFTTAGTNYSYFTAEAILPPFVTILTTDGNFGFTNGNFGFDISGPPGSNVVIQTSTDLQTWLPLQTNTLNPSGLLYFSDTQSPANTQRFYNVVLP